MKTSEKLQNIIHPWITDNAIQQSLTSIDGISINTYHVIHPQEKAMVIMLHGFCGFFVKYHELFYNLYHAGFSVCMLELRGHGLSEATNYHEDRRVYVNSFDEYVEDLHVCYAYAKSLSKTKKMLLFGHSMGGCVSGLYIEKYPSDFIAAVLSSPMLMMNYGSIPPQAVDAMGVYSWVVKNGQEYAPGQGAWEGKYSFVTSSDDSEERYAYQFQYRNEESMYHTWGGTWAWAAAAKEASRKVLKDAKKCKIPVLICQAGNDTMVKSEGQEIFKRRSSNTSLAKYPSSKHEIYGSFDEVVERYTRDIITFYKAKS